MSLEPWDELLVEIATGCRAIGSWSGEARRLRDAVGLKRLGPRGSDDIVSRLLAAGYEIDEAPRSEGMTVIVTPVGTRDLAAIVEGLLPDLRALDAATPELPWKDALVSSRAVGRWLASQRTDGRR